MKDKLLYFIFCVLCNHILNAQDELPRFESFIDAVNTFDISKPKPVYVVFDIDAERWVRNPGYITDTTYAIAHWGKSCAKTKDRQSITIDLINVLFTNEVVNHQHPVLRDCSKRIYSHLYDGAPTALMTIVPDSGKTKVVWATINKKDARFINAYSAAYLRLFHKSGVYALNTITPIIKYNNVYYCTQNKVRTWLFATSSAAIYYPNEVKGNELYPFMRPYTNADLDTEVLKIKQDTRYEIDTDGLSHLFCGGIFLEKKDSAEERYSFFFRQSHLIENNLSELKDKDNFEPSEYLSFLVYHHGIGIVEIDSPLLRRLFGVVTPFEFQSINGNTDLEDYSKKYFKSWKKAPE